MGDDAPRAVKFVDGTDGMIEGLAIPYGGPPYLEGKDFDKERFTPETDLHLDWFPDEGRPFLFGHGMDDEIKAVVVGRQVEREPMDVGQWVKIQLDKRGRYLEHIQRLVDARAMQFSSGAYPNLVRVDRDGTIKSWPWVEQSGTPIPSNPLADAGWYTAKSADAIEHLTAVKAADALTSILEREVGSESEPFAAHAERVTALLDAFADRALSRHDARAKAGRELSAANRAEITEVVNAIAALNERGQRLADLLARSDPSAAEASKAAEAELLRFLREQARANGVPLV